MTPLPEFDRVFAQHHRSLYGFLVRMTGRAEVAEELLQETFVRYARHRDRLPADANLRAWLFTVARNLYRSHRRWAWLDGQRLAELAARAVGVDPGPTPSEVLAATQTQRAVEGALAAMPDTLREVAVLVWTQHLTPAEVALVLGLEPDAVRQRLLRARQFVDQALTAGGSP